MWMRQTKHPQRDIAECARSEHLSGMTSITTSLLLLAVALLGNVLAAPNDFEIEFVNPSCSEASDKVKNVGRGNNYYVENGKYRVLGAKLFWTDPNGKIVGLTACRVPASSRCAKRLGKTDGKPTHIFLEVTLLRTSFEDQDIHYMYNDETFQLSKLEKPTDSPNKIHSLTNFLYAKSVRFQGAEIFKAADCKKNRVKSFISGHGYFITNVGDRTGSWHNMYYSPDSVGQYITVPK